MSGTFRVYLDVDVESSDKLPRAMFEGLKCLAVRS